MRSGACARGSISTALAVRADRGIGEPARTGPGACAGPGRRPRAKAFYALQEAARGYAVIATDARRRPARRSRRGGDSCSAGKRTRSSAATRRSLFDDASWKRPPAEARAEEPARARRRHPRRDGRARRDAVRAEAVRPRAARNWRRGLGLSPRRAGSRASSHSVETVELRAAETRSRAHPARTFRQASRCVAQGRIVYANATLRGSARRSPESEDLRASRSRIGSRPRT